jgi:hypothetical protein
VSLVLGSVLVAALLGSLHCAGMCGPFVCFYAGSGEGRRLGAHAAYNGGRLLSYLTLGALAGALGAGVDRMAAAAGVSRAAAVLAGLAMVLWGGAALLHAAGVRLPETGAGSFARARLAAAVRAVHAQPPAVRALVLGLLTTLLPCGFLYAFVAVAAGTGSAPAGMLVMAAFWAGTVPVMAGLGAVAQRALGPLRRRLPVVTASILVVFGLLAVSGVLRPGVMGAHPAAPCCTHARP